MNTLPLQKGTATDCVSSQLMIDDSVRPIGWALHAHHICQDFIAYQFAIKDMRILGNINAFN